MKTANGGDEVRSPVEGVLPPFMDGTPHDIDPDRILPREVSAFSSSRVTPLDLAQAQRIVDSRHKQWDGQDADELPFSFTEQQYTVHDGMRRYVFKGLRLAYVSSERGHKPRWTDIVIYKTSGGRYLTDRVGVSAVAHVGNCPVLSQYGRKIAAGVDSIASTELAATERTPCNVCRPDLHVLLHSDPASLLFERDRHVVVLADTPEKLIESLHQQREGRMILGSLAASALQLAADRDPVLASRFYGKWENGELS